MFIEKTIQGYYKLAHMHLSNKELYIYNNKEEKKERQFVMLTPRTFVKGFSYKFGHNNETSIVV